MKLPKLPFRQKSSGNQALEPIEAPVQQIVDRCKVIALEQGWAASQGEELDRHMQAAIEGARAELVLLKRFYVGFEVFRFASHLESMRWPWTPESHCSLFRFVDVNRRARRGPQFFHGLVPFHGGRRFPGGIR